MKKKRFNYLKEELAACKILLSKILQELDYNKNENEKLTLDISKLYEVIRVLNPISKAEVESDIKKAYKNFNNFWLGE